MGNSLPLDLLQAQKEFIYDGISQLDDESTDMVISCIKDDGGLLEKVRHCLELDINTISNDCLLKILDIVTSNVPGIADHISQQPWTEQNINVIKKWACNHWNLGEHTTNEQILILYNIACLLEDLDSDIDLAVCSWEDMGPTL